MWPNDLNAIFSALDDLSTAKGFPAETRPFIAQEVIDRGGTLSKILYLMVPFFVIYCKLNLLFLVNILFVKC